MVWNLRNLVNYEDLVEIEDDLWRVKVNIDVQVTYFIYDNIVVNTIVYNLADIVYRKTVSAVKDIAVENYNLDIKSLEEGD